MRWITILFLVFMLACGNNQQHSSTATSTQHSDTSQVKKEPLRDTLSTKSYNNQRFRDVTIERIGIDSFLVRGQGQIFEANFGWVVEDGHEELKQGSQMTDAGAPEWGNFKFGIRVPKKQASSTLTLILFESSPKDGSRQFELPITLY